MKEKNCNPQKRIEWIDRCRGIAILMVVAGHILDEGLLKQWIYSFHMPLFFFLTGVILNEKGDKYESASAFLRKKVCTLIYPYFTFSFLSLLYRLVFEKALVGRGILYTLTFNGIAVLWFLPALFIAETVCFFICKIKRRWIAVFFCIFCAIITWCFSLFDFQTQPGIYYWAGYLINIWNRGLIGSVFVIFGKGISYSYKKIKNTLSNCSLLWIGIALFVVNGVLFRWNTVDLRNSEIGNPILFYANGMAGSIWISVFCMMILRKCRVLEAWGRNSVIIFATHMNLGLTTAALEMINRFDNEMRIVMMILSIVLIMLLESLLIVVVNQYLGFLIKIPKGRGRRTER